MTENSEEWKSHRMDEENKACINRHIVLRVKGIVQGVGFRPFVYNLARSLNLTGYVKNTDDGVTIEIEGGLTGHFIDSLKRYPPPLADIKTVEILKIEEPGNTYDAFSIIESEDGEGFTLTSPDVSVCGDCLSEMMDRNDRRYLYPFINCTNCGPRYTITEKVPYDRPNTTMKVFRMCPDCEREYNDPSDRRFHAQPNACPECGPSLAFEALDKSMPDNGLSPLEQALSFLKDGRIIAVKGLGGFHICCNALNADSVSRLRKEKRRNNKPFALMAPDVETIERYCYITAGEKRLLLSHCRPVVLLKKRRGMVIPESIAPGIGYLGFMLPYTPLHYLLFKHPAALDSELKCLVMTSGNLAEEPIVTDNDEAKKVLSGIVEGFLFHNRDIFMRTDDSVSAVLQDGEDTGSITLHIRRARGFVPEAIPLESEGPEVLGVGADMKNTFTLTKGKYAIPSQHIGDMENYESLKFYEETLDNLKRVYRVEPVAAGYDIHPGYYSTKWALRHGQMKLIPVQHHHAHIASVMAGYGLDENVIGIVLDGTGMGTDGNLWGGEFLVSNAINFRRVGHFRYIPLIGGESSIRQPWKTAVSFIKEAVQSDVMEYLIKIGFLKKYGERNINNLIALSDNRKFCPLSSGAGRFFDAVSAIIGVCDTNTFEAEAPMKLESLVRDGIINDYPVDIILREPIEIDFSMTMVSIMNDFINGVKPEVISTRFHNSIIGIIVRMAKRLREDFQINKIVLAGGTFQNRYLLSHCLGSLKGSGFDIYINKHVPCNDAGISLGQAYIVREKIRRGIE
ncbi:carbamoyltransferase HypF [bacterium BMS3Bbin05]|nr:carbamoyltransferase HypF [bacterium BMS3Bbin05]